jgi:hypothetical protein
MGLLKKKLKSIMPHTLYKFLHDCNVARIKYQNGMRKRWGGHERPQESFYVIRWDSNLTGLGGLAVQVVLGGLKYAEQNNMTPVVDFLHGDNYYRDPQRKGNIWEWYFDQPAGLGLENIQHCKNVVLGAKRNVFPYIVMPDGAEPSASFFANPIGEERKEWRRIYQKYIRLNAEMEATAQKRKNEIIMPCERVCGVLCRGTDYLNHKPAHHPAQPSLEEVISKAQEVMEQHSCDKIFLATEDADIMEAFRKVFGNRLISAYKQDANYNRETRFIRTDVTPYRAGLEYLCTLSILSQCTCIVATACGGSMMASLMAQNPEYEYYFWRGLYGENGN